jgi:cytochrome c oxidase cbb3-type subunit III
LRRNEFITKQMAAWVLILVSGPGAAALRAQNAGGPPGGGQAAGAFPARPKGDPAAIARGKAAYGTNCAYCHGEDARGGENGGTNLLRSDYVMKDKNGEVLGQFLRNPGADAHSSAREGVLKFQFTGEQAADIAAFLHDFRLSSRDPGRMRPPTIVVGDAKAGEAYFSRTCSSCHSVAGDLKGIAAHFTDPTSLQQTWLMPRVYGSRGPNALPEPADSRVLPVTVTVTLANGQKVEGRLGRIDDFIVTLTDGDGATRSFRRDGEVPKVELHDPMKAHKDLLPRYTDGDIHNVTAYLVTIK